jgi:formylglycine-generating enzyme required for sulfatase activity
MTITPTRVLTGTISPTSSLTGTNTPLATATVTQTITPTGSPVDTFTLTITPTDSPVDTFTITQTITPTDSPVDTLTVTQTVTTTCTSTVTSTSTNTPIPYSDIVVVPGGTFNQSDGTSSFSHTISGFLIGKYMVTYDLWYLVRQWSLSNGYSYTFAGAEGCSGTYGAAPTGNRYMPVTSMTWREAIIWCNAYSQMTGLTPVYYTDAGFTTPLKYAYNGSYGSGIDPTAGEFDNPYVKWSANGYRLPTEGEYQYAASYKDGTSWTPWNYASGATADFNNTVADGVVAWYGGSVNTQAVGLKVPNALGLYDMSGNEFEWCWDWNGAYPGDSVDYRGPATGTERVARGGDFYRSEYYIETGFRFKYTPYPASYEYGLRVARSN